ncbi:MAG: hypothetical protein WC581_03415 [Thermodesulfovibrionales bacterium]
MKYIDTLNAVDTVKALKLLNLEGNLQGAYVKYPCQKCGKTAVIKAYGEKKNLWYCPDCKKSGHIISMVMDLNECDWETAKKLLQEKACFTGGKLTKELTLTYELEYDKSLDIMGISQETCKTLGVGKPKGKTMLSGTISFTVTDNDKKIAYYGVRIKDGKHIFHNSFNPELYLLYYDRIEPDNEVYFTTDMFDCLKLWDSGYQAVCNFGLPYLSQEHFKLMNKFLMISIRLKDHEEEIAFQALRNLQMYFRILREASLSKTPQEK